MADSILARVPAHLRHHVVEQDYAAYDPISQAVWRFVVLHTHARLLRTAHPSYESGFLSTGMHIDRIPKISEMNDCLGRFGWGAVCVDGFIPPRAFVEFQSLGILPIAADIRTLEHLAYTPAPDIIHEAAGHAPILINPEFATFIRQIGSAGTKAFTLPEDDAVYRAIYTLSEVKEDPNSSPQQIAAAHAALDRAVAKAERVSEATQLARLYWWTAEYGLVGTPSDYKLYGAGLLSSLWESYSCHSSSVGKLPLTPACIDVSYDITRPQPQLFVVEDLSNLTEVLEPVTADLGFRRGGNVALERAIQSEAIATLELDSGAQISGSVTQFGEAGGEPAWVQFSGKSVFCFRGKPLFWQRTPLEATDYRLPIGKIASQTLGSRSGTGHPIRDASGAVSFEYASGARVSGTVIDKLYAPNDEPAALILDGCTIHVPGRPPLHDPAPYPLFFGSRVTAFAGAAHPAHESIDERPKKILVPKPRKRTARERELQQLYDRALEAWRQTAGSDLVAAFGRVHSSLERHFPDDWLLRWNLLESLAKLGYQGDLTSKLEAELEALEIRYQNREPIATGLRSLLEYKRRHA